MLCEDLVECLTDSDCDDGVFCNGQERCLELNAQAVDPSDPFSASVFVMACFPPEIGPCSDEETCNEAGMSCELTSP